MSDVLNPYIVGSPISGTEMFFGRTDIFKSVRDQLSGRHRDNVIVLHGQRRTGKTSALLQMSRHVDARYLCVFIDLHSLALDGIGIFLWSLADTIVRVLRRDYKIVIPRPDRAAFSDEGARAAFTGDFLTGVYDAIDGVETSGGERHVLLMLDEVTRLQEKVEAGDLNRDIFDYLRSLVQAQERLNFIFSLGSGLEELRSEYTRLFSVALVMRISFLARTDAVALMTAPIRNLYVIDDAAIAHILNITSGHPYFIQLICHQLFTRWQEHRMPVVHVEDVDAILDVAGERGISVLKQIWDESTPGQKAVMAAMAASDADPASWVTGPQIRDIWKGVDIDLPTSELNTALPALIEREVIQSRGGEYAFQIDLQRRWARQQRRLEWTKEEISEASAAWHTSPGEASVATRPPPATAPFVPSSLPSLDWSADDDEEADTGPPTTTSLTSLAGHAGAAALDGAGAAALEHPDRAEPARMLSASDRERPAREVTVLEYALKTWLRGIVVVPLIVIGIVLGTAALGIVVPPLLFPAPTPTPSPTAVVQAPVFRPPPSAPTTAPPTPVPPTPAPATPVPPTAPSATAVPAVVGTAPCGTERRTIPAPGGGAPVVMGVDIVPNHDGPRPQKTVAIGVTSSGVPGDNAEATYRQTLDYLKTPGLQASFHVLVGPSAICQLVKDDDTAWAGGSLDATHLFIILSEPSGGDDFTEYQYRAAAAVVRAWSEEYKIPLQVASDEKSPGLYGRSHATSTRQTTDGRFRWPYFLDLARAPLP